MKKMLSVLLFSLFIVTNLTANHASALTYNNSIDLEYNINPTLDVSFNTNTGFIIEDLAPGNASYSNTVVITASSNNSDGYNLLASVGDSNDVNRNNNRLVNTNNVNYFESVAANADLELSALGENKWGYAIYNSDTSAWSNYNGLPAVSADRSSDLTLVSTDTAGDTEVLMRIGASATNTQVAGEFTNKINFFVTTNVVTYDYSITYNANDGSDGSGVANMPNNVSGSLQTGQELLTSSNTPIRSNYEFLGWCDGVSTDAGCSGNIYSANDFIKLNSPINNTNGNVNSVTLSAIWGAKYMQDITLAECRNRATDQPVIAYDRRDENDYTIRFIADDCWMTQNLRITGIIAAEYSNFEGDEIDISSDLTNGGSLNTPRTHVGYDSQGSPTVWYNFAAASARTIIGESNYGTVVNDICPAGWGLPTRDMSATVIKHMASFRPVAGGRFKGDSLGLNDNGAWWTKDPRSGENRYEFAYDSITNTMWTNSGPRSYGYYVRCVRIP